MPAHDDVDGHHRTPGSSAGGAFALGPLAPSYPDPRIRTLDDRFAPLTVFSTAVERIATGCRWAEGPVWFGDQRQLVWSDIPNDRMLRWDEQTGRTSVFRAPSGFANGSARDHEGRLVTCEHGARRVTRTEHDGAITVLADRAPGTGNRLNSPNDVAIAGDGAVWFTDPRFGIATDHEGHRAASETHPDVYRVDPVTGVVAVVTNEFNDPNGIAFSPDGQHLYIVESTGDEAPDGVRANPGLWVLDVVANGTGLGRRRLLVDGDDGAPDGLAIDEHGNLWCGWNGRQPAAHGVRVFSPAGEPIGVVDLPEPCANVAFGGRAGTRLFMAAGMSLYAVDLAVRGAPPQRAR